MSLDQALQNLPPECPPEIYEKQTVIEVSYYSFDGQIHTGQVVIDRDLVEDIKTIFDLALQIKFPIGQVKPIADQEFQWSDDRSMSANNTSAFNFRFKVGSNELSTHALGRAIDINPKLNPYIRDGVILPEGSTYSPGAAGVLSADHPIVLKFKELGWTWGGDWQSLKDYQHFEKPLLST